MTAYVHESPDELLHQLILRIEILVKAGDPIRPGEQGRRQMDLYLKEFF